MLLLLFLMLVLVPAGLEEALGALEALPLVVGTLQALVLGSNTKGTGAWGQAISSPYLVKKNMCNTSGKGVNTITRCERTEHVDVHSASSENVAGVVVCSKCRDTVQMTEACRYTHLMLLEVEHIQNFVLSEGWG